MTGTIEWAEITQTLIPISAVVVGAVLWIDKRIDAVKTEMAEFKQEVAKEYASMATLEKFESRLLAAIDKLGDRLYAKE